MNMRNMKVKEQILFIAVLHFTVTVGSSIINIMHTLKSTPSLQFTSAHYFCQ